MDAPAITLADATPEHFGEIVRMERAIGAGSVVAAAGIDALTQAHARGHWLIVATVGERVAGWAWFGIEIDRGGEYAGQVFRVAVDHVQRRGGVGRALMERVRDVMRERDCAHVRLNVDAADEGARSFFIACGFSVDSVSMGQRL
jgi:GNAT superfamily N-acetyltransferase